MNKHIYPIESFNTTLFIQNMSQLRILSSWQNWNFFCHLAILLLSCDLTTTSMAPETNGENMLCRMNSDPSWGFSILNVWDFVRFLWGWFGKNGCWTKWIFYLSKMEIGGFQHKKLKATRILDSRLPNPWCWYFLQCWSPRSCPQILDISQIRPENISEINACAWCGRAIWHQIKRNALALTSKFRSKLRTKNTQQTWLQFSKWIA